MPYPPTLLTLYVPCTFVPVLHTYGDKFKLGKRYDGGSQAAPIGSPDRHVHKPSTVRRNTIVLQQTQPYRNLAGGKAR